MLEGGAGSGMALRFDQCEHKASIAPDREDAAEQSRARRETA